MSALGRLCPSLYVPFSVSHLSLPWSVCLSNLNDRGSAIKPARFCSYYHTCCKSRHFIGPLLPLLQTEPAKRRITTTSTHPTTASPPSASALPPEGHLAPGVHRLGSTVGCSLSSLCRSETLVRFCEEGAARASESLSKTGAGSPRKPKSLLISLLCSGNPWALGFSVLVQPLTLVSI